MNTLMPAPVAKPQIGKQAVAARLRAGAHFSSSRVHACESSLAGQTGASKRSPEITAAMEAVYIRAKELNRVGALA